MIKINLEENDIFSGSLILVNRDHPIIEKNTVRLAPVDSNLKPIQMELKAAVILSKLMCSINCMDEIIPVSGYRCLEEQQKIYEDSLLEYGSEFTHQYVALPNCSEHQTGLAIDLGEKMKNIDFIRPQFSYTGICGVFREKATHYGFIERYESGKELITGISHEPWHFRYVGYPHSHIMKHNQLSLEEYIDFIRAYPYEGEHFFLDQKGISFEIFFVSSNFDKKTIEIPDDQLFQMSGNNIDGFIVTLWRQLS